MAWREYSNGPRLDRFRHWTGFDAVRTAAEQGDGRAGCSSKVGIYPA